MAQVVVSAPFYVQAGTSAFRRIDTDLLVVARTLGATSSQAFLRVAVPLALPGLVGGGALAWARSLGEFGATLLFAGNLSGSTRTMPLAIYTALESDVRAALALSLVLAAMAVVVLVALRAGPSAWASRRRAGLDASEGRSG
jgi:molybdate transport system permease protein